jgi:hypothetical protein
VVDIEAIRVKALRAVLRPDIQASLRKIFRWYSTTYATPLHIVDDLPLDDILVAYFEENYWNMEQPLLEREINELSLTPAEREEFEKSEEDSIDAFAAQIAADIAAKQNNIKMTFPQKDNLLEQLGDLDPLAPPKKVR